MGQRAAADPIAMHGDIGRVAIAGHSGTCPHPLTSSWIGRDLPHPTVKQTNDAIRE